MLQLAIAISFYNAPFLFRYILDLFDNPPDMLECVSKLKLMNYREKGVANYRRIVYNRRSKNNEGAQIKWQDDTKLMMHSGKE